MALIYEISDEAYESLHQGARNIIATNKSQFKSLDSWTKAGSPSNICVIRDGSEVRDDLRIHVSKIDRALQRMTPGNGTEG
jgi:hypothetical protein